MILSSSNLRHSSSTKGPASIEVTFDIEANGIVTNSAKDKVTNNEKKITLRLSGGLTDREIEKMVREAELHAQSDKRGKH
ncbi:heat shock 70 kDa protein [Pyrus ussuriensis x Pyrus communis]|uniref:Heat shock 70 kDa protein n=1 Tax=Pyrus ussuriensis x Pyrus communis TaxID=2448454 RepID=A0A5N5GNM4_9ROSA|nr:heat shock 70 kDa protein [Pyrus ussuriensis x Pyrus communis]